MKSNQGDLGVILERKEQNIIINKKIEAIILKVGLKRRITAQHPMKENYKEKSCLGSYIQKSLRSEHLIGWHITFSPFVR